MIETIIEKIQSLNKLNKLNEPFDIFQTTNLQIFIGGGVDDDINLIRQGLLLLNQNTIDVSEQLRDRQCEHLYQNLRGKLKMIPPITYLESNPESDDGESNPELDDAEYDPEEGKGRSSKHLIDYLPQIHKTKQKNQMKDKKRIYHGKN